MFSSVSAFGQKKTETIEDIDGNIYKIVKVGDQWWMAANLKTTRYSNGDSIGTTTLDTLDISETSIPKFQWVYAGKESNVTTFGRFYTWYAATDSRNICPDGWKVPSDMEWKMLIDFLGEGTIAGGRLKIAGITYWQSPNIGATNSNGFSALPGGYRSYNGTYYDLGSYGYWWSSKEGGKRLAQYLTLGYKSKAVASYNVDKAYGFSVRCIKSEGSVADAPVVAQPATPVTAKVAVPVTTPIMPPTTSTTTKSVSATTNKPATAPAPASSTLSVSPSLSAISTNAISRITSSTAISGGNISSTDDESVLFRGVCWDIRPNPTISGSKTTDGSGGGIFSSSISGLSSGSKYYLRAYAIFNTGTRYGDEVTFSTLADIPKLTTRDIDSLSKNAARSGGYIISDGGAPVFGRGVCWSINQNPTIADNRTIDGEGVGFYISSANELVPGTIYYIRAYATNNAGTAYGNQLAFSTLNIVPSITTNAVSSIGETAATGGGNIPSPGDEPILFRGVCWSARPNPTISDRKTTDGSDIGSFSSSITGLTPGRKYYVRAYAYNTSGTAYGNEVSFTTLKPLSPLSPSKIETVNKKLPRFVQSAIPNSKSLKHW
jgi:uncharacterized protein (TIGR02145 family)